MASCSPIHTPVPLRVHHGIGHSAPSHPVYHPVRPVHHPVRVHHHHPPQYGPPAPKPPPKPAAGCERAPGDGGLKDGVAAHAGAAPGGGAAAASGGTAATGAGVAAGAGALSPAAVAAAFMLAAGSLGLAASVGGGTAQKGALQAAFGAPGFEGSAAPAPSQALGYLVCGPGAGASPADAAEARCLVVGPNVAGSAPGGAGERNAPTNQVADTPQGKASGPDVPADVEAGPQKTEEARAVPEPGTLLILATSALAALGLRSLRRGLRGGGGAVSGHPP